MKKWFSVSLVIVLFVFALFSGCNTTNIIDKASKNITHYSIDAVLSNEYTMSAKQTVSYVNNTSANLSSVLFHLYPNAFRGSAVNKPVYESSNSKSYPNGFSEGGIDILSVSVGASPIATKLSGEDNNILEVPLNSTLAPNSVVSIIIGFALTIPNIAHRFGYGDNTINLGNWYPIACVYESGEFNTNPYSPNGDPFYSDIANYSVSISHPNTLIMASTGYTTESRVSGNSTNAKIEAKAVRDFAMVFSTEFRVMSDTVGDTKVSYYYYNEDDPIKYLQTSIDAVKTFNKLFGAYPYRTLSVVKASFLHGGMEYPNLVYVSDSVTIESEYQNVIIHEIAHQWWYGVVGNDEVSHPWLDEGLTEFSTALFYKYNEGYVNTYAGVIGNAINAYLLFCDVYASFYGKINSNMNRCLYEYSTEPEYVYMTYVRGLLMFDSIMEAVGEKKMLKALSHYYKTCAMTNATPNDLIDCLEKSTHIHLRSLIESWLDGKVIIEELNG